MGGSAQDLSEKEMQREGEACVRAERCRPVWLFGAM